MIVNFAITNIFQGCYFIHQYLCKFTVEITLC